jgi:hypothetical protein
MTTIGCFLAWGIVLFRIDPETSGLIGHFSFYASLFLGVGGILTLLGFCLRYLFLGKETPFRTISISMRQALWFTLFVVISLLLLAHQLFVWWSVILLVIGLGFLEFFFLTQSQKGHDRKTGAN